MQYKSLYTIVLHSPGHSCQTPGGNTSPRSPSLCASMCSSFWNNLTTICLTPVLTTPFTNTVLVFQLEFQQGPSLFPSIKGNSIYAASLLRGLRTLTKGILLCVRQANENKRWIHYTREVTNQCLLNQDGIRLEVTQRCIWRNSQEAAASAHYRLVSSEPKDSISFSFVIIFNKIHPHWMWGHLSKPDKVVLVTNTGTMWQLATGSSKNKHT